MDRHGLECMGGVAWPWPGWWGTDSAAHPHRQASCPSPFPTLHPQDVRGWHSVNLYYLTPSSNRLLLPYPPTSCPLPPRMHTPTPPPRVVLFAAPTFCIAWDSYLPTSVACMPLENIIHLPDHDILWFRCVAGQQACMPLYPFFFHAMAAPLALLCPLLHAALPPFHGILVHFALQQYLLFQFRCVCPCSTGDTHILLLYYIPIHWYAHYH